MTISTTMDKAQVKTSIMPSIFISAYHITLAITKFNFLYPSVYYFLIPAIGGLVHQTIVTGSETLGAFPNTHLWTL